MLNANTAHALVLDLACATLSGGPDQWKDAHERLAGLDGPGWLLLDGVARSWAFPSGVAVEVPAWGTAPFHEPSGSVAVVASMHEDGRIRERAVRALDRPVDPVHAAALAVRLLDHVPAVRGAAADALLPRLDAGCVEPVYGVLLAARDRIRARPALEALVAAVPLTGPLLAVLRGSGQRAVRRWAFGRSALSAEQLLAAVDDEPDQAIRAACARRLGEIGTADDLLRLLRSRSADGRLAALVRLADDVPDDELGPLLADRSPRVRAAARDTARSRGRDVAGWYRERLDGRVPGRTSDCLGGLAATGDAADVDRFAAALADPSPRVRAAGASGVFAVGDRQQVLDLLPPLLLDPSPRVTSAAARLLGRTGPAHTTAAWASTQPWSRRAAWRVNRAGGSWDRVEADLRASADPDPDLAALGRAGVGNWLATEASRTWAPLHGPQRDRLRELLHSVDLTERHRQLIGFHTGIGDDSGPRAGSLQATDPGGTVNDTSTTDIWPTVHAERTALAVDLAGLTDEQWATPSLCAGLSVREVLAHLTSAATLGPLRWMWSVLRCRFDFAKHVADRLAEEMGADAAETMARFERIATSRTSTFGPKAAWLGEVVVHAEDIRRPLGIHHDYPVDVVTRIAEFYVGADFTVPSRTLTTGLRLEATDGPFTAGGGPLVRGSTLALTMAMAGRATYCDDLTGDGVETLRERAVSGP